MCVLPSSPSCLYSTAVTVPGLSLSAGNHVTLTARLLMLTVVKFGATGATDTNERTHTKLKSMAFGFKSGVFNKYKSFI